ncbi:MAG TPA: hypothetical protein VFE53_06860 [Mucilaginibacter sp.]|jgi:hypothetical protein|nr:hypothetical protein [Mucilaginibacter sp.]
MLKLIKYSVCILLLTALATKSFGQVRIRVPVVRRQPPYRERVQVQMQAPGKRLELIKENYISRRLNLTFDQARQFWPLYRQYVQDQTAIRIAKQQELNKSSGSDPSSPARVLELETELVNVRKQYLEQFMKILPPEKVNELYKAEREFNDEMVRTLSERSIRAGN